MGHSSPVVRNPYGDSTPQSGHDSGYLNDNDKGHGKGNDHKHRNGRRSGPLDYSSSQKLKNEGSTSGSRGPSPLPRFAVSRSGPISYK